MKPKDIFIVMVYSISLFVILLTGILTITYMFATHEVPFNFMVPFFISAGAIGLTKWFFAV